MKRLKFMAFVALAACLIGTPKGIALAADSDEGSGSLSLFERLAADFGFWNGVDVETTENTTGTPVKLYDQSIKVPGGYNVISVELSGTGDSHNGAQMYLRCQMDGKDCTSPSGDSMDSLAPAGWTSVLANVGVFKDSTTGDVVDPSGEGFGGDFHNNNVTAFWCVKVTPCEDAPAPDSRSKPKNKKNISVGPCATSHKFTIEMASSGCQDGTAPGFCFGGSPTGELHGLVSIQRYHVFVDAAKVSDKNHQCGNLTPPVL
jgi:hypothetical protein